MKIKKKHPLSIIEIMIVISIIAIVGSVMTHNMKGSLTKGRAFKTESASKQAYDILSLELSSGSTIKQIINSPETILVESGLVKSPKKILQDGWGNNFEIIKTEDDNFILYSKKWIKYLIEDKKMTTIDIEENYPWAYNSNFIQENDAES